MEELRERYLAESPNGTWNAFDKEFVEVPQDKYAAFQQKFVKAHESEIASTIVEENEVYYNGRLVCAVLFKSDSAPTYWVDNGYYGIT